MCICFIAAQLDLRVVSSKWVLLKSEDELSLPKDPTLRFMCNFIFCRRVSSWAPCKHQIFLIIVNFSLVTFRAVGQHTFYDRLTFRSWNAFFFSAAYKRHSVDFVENFCQFFQSSDTIGSWHSRMSWDFFVDSATFWKSFSSE